MCNAILAISNCNFRSSGFPSSLRGLGLSLQPSALDTEMVGSPTIETSSLSPTLLTFLLRQASSSQLNRLLRGQWSFWTALQVTGLVDTGCWTPGSFSLALQSVVVNAEHPPMACTHQSNHHSVEEQGSWVPGLVCGGFMVARAGQPALGLLRVLANDSPDIAPSQGVAPPSR